MDAADWYFPLSARQRALRPEPVTTPPPISEIETAITEIENFPAFTIFSKLPIELKLRIWKFSIPRPQLVRIQVHSAFDVMRNQYWYFNTETQPSSLLRACKSSREEILKAYKVAIRSPHSKSVIRLDGVNDVVWLQRGADTDILHPYYQNIRLPDTFTGVQTLLLAKNQLAIDMAIKIACQFRSLKKLLCNRTSDEYIGVGGNSDMNLQVLQFMMLEESYAPYFPDVETMLSLKSEANLLALAFKKKVQELKESYEIPEIKFIPTLTPSVYFPWAKEVADSS